MVVSTPWLRKNNPAMECTKNLRSSGPGSISLGYDTVPEAASARLNRFCVNGSQPRKEAIWMTTSDLLSNNREMEMSPFRIMGSTRPYLGRANLNRSWRIWMVWISGPNSRKWRGSRATTAEEMNEWQNSTRAIDDGDDQEICGNVELAMSGSRTVRGPTFCSSTMPFRNVTIADQAWPNLARASALH